MRIKISENIELEVYDISDYDEDLIGKDGVMEKIEKGTEGIIVEDYDDSVDIQFDDGSLAVRVPKSIITEVKN